MDCVGFEARGIGSGATGEGPAQVLNDCMSVVREGGAIGIPGLYVTEDPGAVDAGAQHGNLQASLNLDCSEDLIIILQIQIGLGWSLSERFTTGQCPVMKYHKNLMNAILFDKVLHTLTLCFDAVLCLQIKIAEAVNVKMISLDDAPKGYAEFDAGAATKYVIDPHNMTGQL